MNVRRVAFAAVVVLSLSLVAPVTHADSYKLDPVHSTAIFRIEHLNVSYFYGRINGPEGTITVDESDPSKTSFDVTLKVANIDTANPARDKHLKSPTFFSAAEFPTITFKSKSVKPGADNKLEVTGDMTMHGQTKSVAATLEHVGTADTPMGHRTGYDVTLVIKRSDFGMDQMLDGIGDEVKIRIGLEGVKQ